MSIYAANRSMPFVHALRSCHNASMLPCARPGTVNQRRFRVVAPIRRVKHGISALVRACACAVIGCASIVCSNVGGSTNEHCTPRRRIVGRCCSSINSTTASTECVYWGESIASTWYTWVQAYDTKLSTTRVASPNHIQNYLMDL